MDNIRLCSAMFCGYSYPGANFINILSTYYLPIIWHQKLQSWNVTRESCAKHFCTKNVCIKCWWNWHLQDFHFLARQDVTPILYLNLTPFFPFIPLKNKYLKSFRKFSTKVSFYPQSSVTQVCWKKHKCLENLDLQS